VRIEAGGTFEEELLVDDPGACVAFAFDVGGEDSAAFSVSFQTRKASAGAAPLVLLPSSTHVEHSGEVLLPGRGRATLAWHNPSGWLFSSPIEVDYAINLHFLPTTSSRPGSRKPSQPQSPTAAPNPAWPRVVAGSSKRQESKADDQVGALDAALSASLHSQLERVPSREDLFRKGLAPRWDPGADGEAKAELMALIADVSEVDAEKAEAEAEAEEPIKELEEAGDHAGGTGDADSEALLPEDGVDQEQGPLVLLGEVSGVAEEAAGGEMGGAMSAGGDDGDAAAAEEVEEGDGEEEEEEGAGVPCSDQKSDPVDPSADLPPPSSEQAEPEPLEKPAPMPSPNRPAAARVIPPLAFLAASALPAPLPPDHSLAAADATQLASSASPRAKPPPPQQQQQQPTPVQETRETIQLAPSAVVLRTLPLAGPGSAMVEWSTSPAQNVLVLAELIPAKSKSGSGASGGGAGDGGGGGAGGGVVVERKGERGSLLVPSPSGGAEVRISVSHQSTGWFYDATTLLTLHLNYEPDPTSGTTGADPGFSGEDLEPQPEMSGAALEAYLGSMGSAISMALAKAKQEREERAKERAAQGWEPSEPARATAAAAVAATAVDAAAVAGAESVAGGVAETKEEEAKEDEQSEGSTVLVEVAPGEFACGESEGVEDTGGEVEEEAQHEEGGIPEGAQTPFAPPSLTIELAPCSSPYGLSSAPSPGAQAIQPQLGAGGGHGGRGVAGGGEDGGERGESEGDGSAGGTAVLDTAGSGTEGGTGSGTPAPVTPRAEALGAELERKAELDRSAAEGVVARLAQAVAEEMQRAHAQVTAYICIYM